MLNCYTLFTLLTCVRCDQTWPTSALFEFFTYMVID